MKEIIKQIKIVIMDLVVLLKMLGSNLFSDELDLDFDGVAEEIKKLPLEIKEAVNKKS